jgi:hypothetical protein
MTCDLGSAVAGSGLVLEAAAAAVMLFGSVAIPLLQFAVARYAESLLGFAACMLLM